MIDLEVVKQFIAERHTHKAIGEMQDDLEKAITYFFEVGEAFNAAQEDYEKKHAEKINDIERMDEQTETIRAALLKASLSGERKRVQDLGLMQKSLKQIQMTLFQAIKTRSLS